MDVNELRAAAEHIAAGRYYVEARLGSDNYRNGRDGEPCRVLTDGARGNMAADKLLECFARHILATTKADDGEPTDAEYIADARKWAAKIMPDGKPRAEARYVRYVSGWYIRGNDGCVIDPILMEIDRYEPSEDAAWLALGKLLARLREELNY